MKNCFYLPLIFLAGGLFLLSLTFYGCKGDLIEDDDSSTRIGIDLSSNAASADWTDVYAYAYAYGATIGDSGWGDWPGIKLIQSNANPSLFYSADLSDKSLGNGTVIFNNSSDQLEEVSISISNGDKWLLKNGSFVRGTIDSLSGGDSLDVGRLPSLPASLEAEVTVVGVYKSVWATAPEKAYIHVYDGSESVPNVDWPGREMKNGGEYFYFAIPAAWFNDESKITVIVHDNNGEGGKVYSEKQVEKTKNIFVTSNNEAEPWN